MYVNQDTLNTQRQYAYLRHCDGEMALVVANFDDQPVDTAIRIPQHALDCAQMAHGEHVAVNLLTDHSTRLSIKGEVLFPVHIAANSFVMWKISRSPGNANKEK